MLSLPWRGGCVALIALFGIVSFVRGQELPGAKEKWKHLTSPHFEIYTSESEKESREILYNLEIFRHVFVEDAGVSERKKQPLTVFYFGREKTFRAYLPEDWRKSDEIAALCIPGVVRSRCLVKSISSSDRSERLVFSQFVYHLIDEMELRLPSWAARGLATAYSGTQVVEPNLEFGHPIEWHAEELKRGLAVPLDRLLTIKGDDPQLKRVDFLRSYDAECWALAHYLMYGKTNLPKGTAWRLWAALSGQGNSSGSKNIQIVEAVLGMSLKDLEVELKEYIHLGSYRWGRRPIPDLPREKTYPMRQVSADEMELRLIELGVLADQPAARLMMLNRQQKGCADPRFWEVVGERAFRDQDRPGATEAWAKAMALGPVPLSVRRETLKLQLGPLINSSDFSRRLPVEMTEAYRREALLILDEHAEEEDGLTLLGWIEASAVKINASNVKRIQAAFPRMQDRHRALLALAAIRVRVKDYKTANELIAVLRSESEEKNLLNGAEKLQRLLDAEVRNGAGG